VGQLRKRNFLSPALPAEASPGWWLMLVILAIRRQIVHETLSGKTLHKNRAARVAQAKGPEFKPQYHKKKKKKTQKNI
jgi:hypothetical protein